MLDYVEPVAFEFSEIAAQVLPAFALQREVGQVDNGIVSNF
jgi:hypothetical protein